MFFLYNFLPENIEEPFAVFSENRDFGDGRGEKNDELIPHEENLHISGELTSPSISTDRSFEATPPTRLRIESVCGLPPQNSRCNVADFFRGCRITYMLSMLSAALRAAILPRSPCWSSISVLSAPSPSHVPSPDSRSALTLLLMHTGDPIMKVATTAATTGSEDLRTGKEIWKPIGSP